MIRMIEPFLRQSFIITLINFIFITISENYIKK